VLADLLAPLLYDRRHLTSSIEVRRVIETPEMHWDAIIAMAIR
jgi:hypothetical protein